MKNSIQTPSIKDIAGSSVEIQSSEFSIEELPGFELALLQGHDESVFFS